MHSRKMPLFPYLSIIRWRGMTNATDDDAQSMADPTDVSRARISATRGDGGPLAPLAVAFELRYPR
jgi:hypothetical protein